MMEPMKRRRFLTISAAAAGLPLISLSGSLAALPERLHRWQGTALGARVTLLLNHPDRDEADGLLTAMVSEIRRLEGVFSLFQADSALSRLNRDGELTAPPADLTVLLSRARDLGQATGGAFDITVQPLWRLYADHFSRPSANPRGPADADIAIARNLVDYRAVTIDPEGIALNRTGMAITLNGIAQGYVTDKVTDLLRRHGVTDLLVNIGETRAHGVHPSGRPWRAGVHDPARPGRLLETLEMRDQALATSGGYGSPFDLTGRHHHLFDPNEGRSANRYLSISVVAPTATAADGLSTAFASMPKAAMARSLAACDATAALLVEPGGNRMWIRPEHGKTSGIGRPVSWSRSMAIRFMAAR